MKAITTKARIGRRQHGAIRGPLGFGLAASLARLPARAGRGRLLHEGEHDERRQRGQHGAEVEDRVEAGAAAAGQVVERRRQRRPDDQAAELRRRQDAVGLAAVALGRDVGDERLAGGPHGRRADALEQRKTMNHSGFAVVVKRNIATAYRATPATITGLRPMLSLSQPSGDEKSSVPT